MGIRDRHAMVMHAMGLDHERLDFRHMGRDDRLTDFKGKVNTAILRG